MSVSRRLKRWFPWIALAITLVLLGWGAQRSGVAESWKFILAGPANEDTDIEEIGASDSFTVVGPKRYLSDNEIDALLDEAEAVRAELIEFLQIPEPESTITLRVRPQDGLTDTATGQPNRIDLYRFKAQDLRLVLAHEMTHSLLPKYSSSFVREGLAEAAAIRLGGPCFCPSLYYSVHVSLRPFDSFLYSLVGGNLGLIPLIELQNLPFLRQPTNLPLSGQRYSQAGSFVDFLIERYGIGKFLEVYESPRYGQVYGKSLDKLDGEWRRHLRRSHLLLGLLMTVGFGLALVVVHMALFSVRSWIPQATVGALALSAWSFHYGYVPLIPVFLLLVAAAAIISRLRRRIGLWFLWSGGALSLVFLMTGPAIAGIP